MRVLFMGSGPLACPALRVLLERSADLVVAVVTQPDRPSGRHQRVQPCPVRKFVENRNVPVLAPEDVNDPAVVRQLKAFEPEVLVVADFGQFLKPGVLALPSKTSINIHPSLLPKYRGAAPIQWAIANGEVETGVTILHVTEKMDAGDIILQEKAPIRDQDTATSLEPLLAELGATLLVRALDEIRAGGAPRLPQDESKVTFAPKLEKEDGRINWSQPAETIRNRIRGFQPWPGCFCKVPTQVRPYLKVLQARVEEGKGKRGTVLECGEEGPLVACGQKALRLLLVQPEGKKPMLGGAYLRGHKLAAGEMLG
ncbi:MAG: methionyl-tRNA formyltransferase [Verrucomicrobiota bacterium]